MSEKKPKRAGNSKPKASLYKKEFAPPSKDIIIPEKSAGAPSQIMEEKVRKEIINAVRMGIHPEVACTMAGVNLRTFQLWMLKGRREYNDPTSQHAALLQSIISAWAEAEGRAVSTLDSFASGRPAVYERDKDGNIIMQTIVDKDGNKVGEAPIVLRSEVKPDWRAALEKLKATFPRRWSYIHHVNQPDPYEAVTEIEVGPESSVQTPDDVAKADDRLQDLLDRFSELKDIE